MSDFELIFFGAVAIFFGYRLWTVLGRTNGDEKARATEMSAIAERQRAAAEEAKKAKSEGKTIDGVAIRVEEEKIPAHLVTDVENIRKIDKVFSLKQFLGGAVGAFETVVKAFAEKKREQLQFLLSKEVYTGFEEELKERETSGHDYHTTIVAMEDPEILDIEVKGSLCQVVVKFISEQINFVKTKAGEIIEGSNSHMHFVTDIWTFERDLNSKKPNWVVVGIQEA